MYNVKESDWKIFRKKIIGWQESHMKKLNEEYIELLQRIWNDKKSVGVAIDMRRSMMFNNILSLIDEEIIQVGDLEDFSEEFQEDIKQAIKMWR